MKQLFTSVYLLLFSCHVFGAAAPDDSSPSLSPSATSGATLSTAISGITELPIDLSKESVFCIPTYDAPFKYMMTNEKVRKSFIEAFVPGAEVKTSHLKGEAINPVQIKRQSIKPKAINAMLKMLNEAKDLQVTIDGKIAHDSFLEQLRILARYRYLVAGSFHPILKQARVDVAFEIEYIDMTNNSLVTVEVQVIPENYWEQRALYYVSSLYAQQLCKGESFSKLFKVIGINILGGIHRYEHPPGSGSWRDKTYRWDKELNKIRHYTFKDQYSDSEILGIQLIQYPIFSLKDQTSKQMQHWLKLLTSAHLQSLKILSDKTLPQPIIMAYTLLQEKSLPQKYKFWYNYQKDDFTRYSKQTARDVAEATEIERATAYADKLESARKMKRRGYKVTDIAEDLGLSVQEIEKL